MPRNTSPSQVTFFWDYDTQWGGDRSRAGRGPKDWGHLDFSCTDRLLDLHAEYDIPACFAVVGAAALPGKRPYHDPQQIQRIYAAGHEVASHSFRHDWLPGLDRRELVATLRDSKDAIEQTLGSAITTFVPPYNQPFDYPGGLSFSLSERREAGRSRTDLPALCDALYDVGYRVCRVVYRGLHLRVAAALMKRRIYGSAGPMLIQRITCLRINIPCGFAAESLRLLRRQAGNGSLIVVHAHPHSLVGDGSQSEKYLVPFLQETARLRDAGALRVVLPRELAAEQNPSRQVFESVTNSL